MADRRKCRKGQKNNKGSRMSKEEDGMKKKNFPLNVGREKKDDKVNREGERGERKE